MRVRAASLALAIAAILAGCDGERFGTVLHENAEVSEICFVPAGHGAQYGYGFEPTTHRLVYSYAESDIPPAFAAVLKCEHGKFVIAGPLAVEIARHFKAGDKLTVFYREVIVDAGARGARAVALQYLYVLPGVNKTPPLNPPPSFE